MSSKIKFKLNQIHYKILYFSVIVLLEAIVFWFVSQFITPKFPLAILLLVAGLIILYFFAKLFRQPVYVLLLGLLAIYNPIYVYLVLTSWWRHGSTRVLISAFFIIVLFLIYLTQAWKKKSVKIPSSMDKYLFFSGLLIIIIGLISILRGNDIKFILADMFPLLEFIVYFFFATTFIKNKKQLYIVVFSLIAWLLIIELGGLIIYIIDPSQFGYQADPGGIVVKRLADFMAALTLPLIIGMYIFLPNTKTSHKVLFTKRKLLFLSLAIIPTISLLLGFFRSLWLGVLASMMVIFMTVMKRKVAWKMVFSSLLIVISLFFVIDQTIIIPQKVFNGTSLYTLVEARIFSESFESNSIRGRFDDQKLMLKGLQKKPIHGYGLGTAPGTSNYYFALLYMLGLPLTLIIFTPVYILYIKLFNVYFLTQNPLDKGIVLGTIAMFTSTAVFLLSFPAVLHFPIFAYLGVFAGIIFLIPKLKDNYVITSPIK